MCSKSFTSDILHFRERERKGQKRPKAFSYLSVLVSNICKLQDFILVNFLLSIKKRLTFDMMTINAIMVTPGGEIMYTLESVF